MALGIFFLIGVFSMAFLPVHWTALQFNQGPLIALVQTFTHMFSHGSWSHLVGNFVFVAPYALYLEYKVGFKPFCRKWLACGLVAAFCHVLYAITIQSYIGVVGSSGAAFGIVGCALMLVDENKIFKIVARLILAYFVLEQLSLTLLLLFNPIARLFFQTAFAAHLGGVLAGIALAIAFKRRKGLSLWKCL